MGQPVQVFAYTGRNIPAHLHALYRTQPRSGDDGGGSGALSLESYRANALGQTSPLLVPHSVYLSLGATDKARQAAYRHLFRYHLDEEMVSELRLAVNQNQPLGNERFYETIERMAGQRREARPRGRPRLSGNVANEDVKGQGDLGLWGKYRAWPL